MFHNAPFDLEISAVVFKIPNVFSKRSAICLFGIVKGRIMVVIARLKFLLSHSDVCFYITGRLLSERSTINNAARKACAS